jgi:hypothetical protein
VTKLTDADGEQYETQHWIETAVECAAWYFHNKSHMRR